MCVPAASRVFDAADRIRTSSCGRVYTPRNVVGAKKKKKRQNKNDTQIYVRRKLNMWPRTVLMVARYPPTYLTAYALCISLYHIMGIMGVLYQCSIIFMTASHYLPILTRVLIGRASKMFTTF